MARCRACRANLPTYDPPRRGSYLDTICNDLVNPRTSARDGTTWLARTSILRAVHRALRGSEPGWGTVPLATIRAQYLRSLRVFYAPRIYYPPVGNPIA